MTLSLVWSLSSLLDPGARKLSRRSRAVRALDFAFVFALTSLSALSLDDDDRIVGLLGFRSPLTIRDGAIGLLEVLLAFFVELLPVSGLDGRVCLSLDCGRFSVCDVTVGFRRSSLDESLSLYTPSVCFGRVFVNFRFALLRGTSLSSSDESRLRADDVTCFDDLAAVSLVGEDLRRRSIASSTFSSLSVVELR